MAFAVPVSMESSRLATRQVVLALVKLVENMITL